MLKALAFCCAAIVAAPTMASAEWHITPLVGFSFAGNTSIIDLEDATRKVHRQFGGAVTLVGGGLFGVEGLFVYTPGFFEQRGGPRFVQHSRTTALMANGVLTFPRRWTEYSLRPFVSGGIGRLGVNVKGDIPVDLSVAGFDVGGGAIGFLSPRTGLRFDVRYYSALHGTEHGAVSFGPVHLRYMTASIGIVFRR